MRPAVVVAGVLTLLLTQQHHPSAAFTLHDTARFCSSNRLCSGRSKGSFAGPPFAATPEEPGCPLTLGFLSFDLDDTLFATSATVNDANERQIEYMNELLGSYGASDKIAIHEFQQTTKNLRIDSAMPVTYTSLRKQAIRRELHTRLGLDVRSTPSSLDLEIMVNGTFDVWLRERHAAAERHLFADALASLDSLRKHYPHACIAAITNGRGNPLDMPNTLADYFDFCVSGEDDAVFPNRKPALGIYEIALRTYRDLYPHHEQAEMIWCHVGDCLANDVGASAECGAYAVWYCPASHDALTYLAASRMQSGGGDNPAPSWSTASTADIKERQHLANQAAHKIATRVSSLSQLQGAISEMLLSAQRNKMR